MDCEIQLDWLTIWRSETVSLRELEAFVRGDFSSWLVHETRVKLSDRSGWVNAAPLPSGKFLAVDCEDTPAEMRGKVLPEGSFIAVEFRNLPARGEAVLSVPKGSGATPWETADKEFHAFCVARWGLFVPQSAGSWGIKFSGKNVGTFSRAWNSVSWNFKDAQFASLATQGLRLAIGTATVKFGSVASIFTPNKA